MTFYNMLFGMNSKSDLLLAVVGLRKSDLDRFRDVSIDGNYISVYTRTGGGNRDDYPNETMRHRPEWVRTYDCDGDFTYAYDELAIPAEFVGDVANLSDVLSHGIRKEFANHLAKTLQRAPTESDTRQAKYEQESASLERLSGKKANGHTFVPYTDYAMEAALAMAEKNDGNLLSCWGILPLKLSVVRDGPLFKGGRDFVRAAINTEWVIDDEYWERCKGLYSEKYPKAMREVAEGVDRLKSQARAA